MEFFERLQAIYSAVMTVNDENIRWDTIKSEQVSFICFINAKVQHYWKVIYC